MICPNPSRRPTLEERIRLCPASAARRGCVLRPPALRIRTLTLLILLLLQNPAPAQESPFVDEHNWTVQVGGARFGLWQYRLLGDEKYGAGRYTLLYFGGKGFITKTRTFRRTTWEVTSAALAALCLLWLLRPKPAKIAPGEPKN